MNQEVIYSFIKHLNTEFIGPLLVFVLLGTGIFLSIRLGFVPRYYLRSLKKFLSSPHDDVKAGNNVGMSPLQALATAVASQVGTGNIVGVAMALVMGGPGALFWMWVSALMGMSTNFSEAVLGQLFKSSTADGMVVGGPAYYIKNGLKSRWLAFVFSSFFLLAMVVGSMVQSNSISSSLMMLFPGSINPLYIGVGLAIFVGLILSGGIARIAKFAEAIVPIMAGMYIVGSIIFILMHLGSVLPVFADIFRYAFTPKAGVGGVAGVAVMSAIRYGVSRGLFSNEAGLGTTPHAHAVAKVKNSYDQGMMAVISISIDVLICTFTGLVLLLSGVIDTNPDLMGIQLMQRAFDNSFGMVGNWFIALSLFFFALSTIVGWYFFATQNIIYLFGEKLIIPYRIFTLVLIVLATVVEVPLIWELMDTFNLFIVLPNIIAVLWLSPKVVSEVKRMKEEISAEDKK